MHEQALLTVTPDVADDVPGPRGELTDPRTVVRYVLAGNAHVTFQSRRTGTRYTYRVVLADPRPGDDRAPPHFVSVLTGPNNDSDYSYLGCIFDGERFQRTAKSHIAEDATSAVAFAWAWRMLLGGRALHPEFVVYHEGRCGRCSRRLTDPDSITSGLGPTCRGKAGL